MVRKKSAGSKPNYYRLIIRKVPYCRPKASPGYALAVDTKQHLRISWIGSTGNMGPNNTKSAKDF